MADYDYDIGVIGAGAAGLTVASGAAQLGAKTLLVEKEEKLGGDCLHFGCVPSKTLIRSAQVYKFIRDSERYGLPKVSAEEVDFSRVASRIQSVIDVIQEHDSVERFASLGVDVKTGGCSFSDEHSLELEGRRYTARKWVIATGSSPAIRPIKGLDKVDYITNREVFSLERLPKSMIILGTGPISTEMAQAFAMLGSEVSVVGRSRQILKREDGDMARMVMEQLEPDGVKFYLNSKILGVSQEAGQKVVRLEYQGQEIQLRGDELLAALGRSANTEELGLEKTGVDFSREGIKVDERLRTNVKHIYAAGDVLGKYLFTHAAGYEGGVVIANAVTHVPRKVNYRWLPWCTYCHPELASVGMNEKRAEEAGVKYSVWKEEFKDNDRSLAEGEGKGTIKLIVDKKERPLGVQILGAGAGELLSEWVAIVNGSVKLSRIAGAIHPYPTLGEINKKVVGDMFAPKLFNDKVRGILRLLFRYRG